MPLLTDHEDQSRYSSPPDDETDDVDPVDDRTDPDGLDSDHWTIAQTINIEPHPSDL